MAQKRSAYIERKMQIKGHLDCKGPLSKKFLEHHLKGMKPGFQETSKKRTCQPTASKLSLWLLGILCLAATGCSSQRLGLVFYSKTFTDSRIRKPRGVSIKRALLLGGDLQPQRRGWEGLKEREDDLVATFPLKSNNYSGLRHFLAV